MIGDIITFSVFVHKMSFVLFCYCTSAYLSLNNYLVRLPAKMKNNITIWLKACNRHFLFFHQIIALQKLWMMPSISCKKIFSFSRYSIFFCISLLHSSFPISHCFRGWPKINLKVYGVINCLELKAFLFDILRKTKGMTSNLFP